VKPDFSGSFREDSIFEVQNVQGKALRECYAFERASLIAHSLTIRQTFIVIGSAGNNVPPIRSSYCVFRQVISMKKRRIHFEDIYPSGPHYARGVRAGNMLFLSGCTANGSPAQNGSPMEQLRVILDRLTRMVIAEGGQPSDICKLTMFVADPYKWHPFEGEQLEIYHEFFGDDYPVNTLVGVTFPMESIHIEIDAIAVLE
jgi:2-iminobutanoate/2-iminopropanoate deaminase